MDSKRPIDLDFPDPSADAWADPVDERALRRFRLRRYRVGFSALAMALLLASLATLGGLILLFSGFRQPLGNLLGIPRWDLIQDSAIVWCSLIGACLLWGRWPDSSWQRRSGLLLMMFLVDLVLWSLDHATDLGLADAKLGHEWFRRSLGEALSWSEFALIASLTSDLAAHLGEGQAIDFGRAARSLATTGSMVWFLCFYARTDWTAPIWPLRERPLDRRSMAVILLLIWWVLGAINLVQVTALSLLAGRSCGRTLREMADEDRLSDRITSRSEAGWEEFTRSGPK